MEMKTNLNSNIKKMKVTIFSLFLTTGMLMLTACSSEREDNSKDNLKEPLQAVQFSITEEGFGEEATFTRTSKRLQEPTISALSDCEAEVSVENEPAEKPVTTRSVTIPTHYTIRIYKDGEMKGEFKGTFSGSTYTPDTGTPDKIMVARNQTYDFVCFNDQVIPNGDKLEITLANAGTARIGRQQITVGTTDQTINLSSKHVGVRLHTQIVAKKDMPTAITATLQSTSNSIPQRVSYNPADGSYTSMSIGAVSPTANNSPASAEPRYYASNSGQNYGYTSTCPDYHYFLPTTDVASLNLTFSNGQIFWKQLTGSTSGFTKTSHPLSANSTYLIKVKMNPNYTYLMSDGSTGTFKQTTQGGGEKIPIGLVVNQTKRIAVALHDANGGNNCVWTTLSDWNRQLNNRTPFENDQVNALFNDLDGYKYTWEPGGSKDGTTIKGNSQTLYPAFYYAGAYTPGVSISGTLIGKKWHLPSAGEWIYIPKDLAWADPSRVQLSPGEQYQWYSYLVDEAFKKVGGESIVNYSKFYWSSSEYVSLSYGYHITGLCARWNSTFGGWYVGYKDSSIGVRSFITY